MHLLPLLLKLGQDFTSLYSKTSRSLPPALFSPLDHYSQLLPCVKRIKLNLSWNPYLCISFYCRISNWANSITVVLVDPAAAKSLQSCPTLCDPMDCSPPGSPIPGILQARTLEWAAISFSNAWKGKVQVKSLSRVRLFATAWTAAHQAPPSMGFSTRPCRGPAPADPGYSKERQHRWGSGNNCLITLN